MFFAFEEPSPTRYITPPRSAPLSLLSVVPSSARRVFQSLLASCSTSAAASQAPPTLLLHTCYRPMPHRSTSSSSSAKDSVLNSPYSPSSRRPSGQPRTSRMQYSACGACRMRRLVDLHLTTCIAPSDSVLVCSVRCDLKDQPYNGAVTPQCGNCTERGLRCVYVDFFASALYVRC